MRLRLLGKYADLLPFLINFRNLEREKGFLTDIHEALERMKELEYETETSFVYEGEEDFRNHGTYLLVTYIMGFPSACLGPYLRTFPNAYNEAQTRGLQINP